MHGLLLLHLRLEDQNRCKMSLCLIVLLVLSKIMAGNGQQCNYNQHFTIANCSFLDLKIVPHQLHKSIITLDISGNYFPTLPNHSFISYNYLKELYIMNNSVQNIESKAFHMLGYLVTLDLSNNKLTEIPSVALEIVSRSLHQLILSGNKIHTINKGTFRSFSSLQVLDLSGNSISRVDPGAFLGLRSLQQFQIRHNALTRLPQDSFDDFPENINKVQLYDNRWSCDCEIRWLRVWLNKTSPSVWDAPGYKIRCDFPPSVRERTLDLLQLDDLACEIQMKTSSYIRELNKGVNTTLVCKYYSVPDADAKWYKNLEMVDVQKNYKKYAVETKILEGHGGERTQQSELRIQDFSYDDIAKYSCCVKNIRGTASTEYRLTLVGVPFESVTPATIEQHASSGVDTRIVVIAVGIVCSLILIIVIGVLIFCSWNRVRRKRQAKKDAIVENVKQHFINSEANISNGDIVGLNNTKQSIKSMEDKLDHTADDNQSNSNNTNDSNVTAVRRPLDLDDREPLYIFEQPESPFNNGNTYISFGSELTDPGEFPAPPPQYPRAPSSRYESSQAGSATPLLGRYTPSVFDSDEQVEDYAQYPVYDSLTNTLQHPHMDSVYRHGSNGGYGSYRSNDAAKRHSGFHYAPSVNGSIPPTPGSTRSTIALAPRYQEVGLEPINRPELYYTTSIPSDYSDYHDARYPTQTPPPSYMTPATKKSMSVGNLGYTPLTLGPRKPPRVFQSREYMELTPQEGSAEYITSLEAQNYSQNYGLTPGTPV